MKYMTAIMIRYSVVKVHDTLSAFDWLVADLNSADPEKTIVSFQS